MPKRIRKKREHATYYDEACPVCQHKDRKAAEMLYAAWEPTAVIAGRLDLKTSDGLLDKKSIDIHMAALGISDKRWDNFKAIHMKFVDNGLEASAEASADTKLKVAFAAAAQIDKIEKRVQPNVQIADNRQIQIVAPPMPWGRVSPARETAALPAGAPTSTAENTNVRSAIDAEFIPPAGIPE